MAAGAMWRESRRTAAPCSSDCAPATVDSRGPESVVAAGRLLDHRYRIEGLLGGGGMSTVWRGRDLRMDRPVAIKELSGEGLRQPMALERFALEARAVGRVSHPN